ncbi:Uncharacterised protein [Bordetella pertussis]|nr:Uncharacterised protein [Bordetella pertussis]
MPSLSASSILRGWVPVSCSGSSALLIEWKSSSQSACSTHGSSARARRRSCVSGDASLSALQTRFMSSSTKRAGA